MMPLNVLLAVFGTLLYSINVEFSGVISDSTVRLVLP